MTTETMMIEAARRELDQARQGLAQGFGINADDPAVRTVLAQYETDVADAAERATSRLLGIGRPPTEPPCGA